MEIHFYWLIAAAILLILEIVTASFGSVFFAIGALLTALVAYLTPSWIAQLVTFAAVSLLSLFFIRPVVLKFLARKDGEVKTNVDAIVGRKAIVSETINADTHTGRVAIDGDDWKAVSATSDIIKKGKEVEVVSRESLVLTVKQR